MEDEIEIDGELDKRENAAGQIGLRQLSSLDEVLLGIQQYNEQKKRLEVLEWLNILLESSGSL